MFPSMPSLSFHYFCFIFLAGSAISLRSAMASPASGSAASSGLVEEQPAALLCYLVLPPISTLRHACTCPCCSSTGSSASTEEGRKSITSPSSVSAPEPASSSRCCFLSSFSSFLRCLHGLYLFHVWPPAAAAVPRSKFLPVLQVGVNCFSVSSLRLFFVSSSLPIVLSLQSLSLLSSPQFLISCCRSILYPLRDNHDPCSVLFSCRLCHGRWWSCALLCSPRPPPSLILRAVCTTKSAGSRW